MKRRTELSFLNVLLCFLVIFIHIASAPVSELTVGSMPHALFFVPWRLSAFVVQGFIFLSGLKMFLSREEKSYFDYYISRFKRIVIPYVFVVCVFYWYFLVHGYFSLSLKDLAGYILKGDLCAHFYFVIVIVQFYILKPLWKYLVGRIKDYVAIPVSFVVMIACILFLPQWISLIFSEYEFIYNDRVFTTYIFYWIAGCYIGKNFTVFMQKLSRFKVLIIALFMISTLTDGILSYLNATGIFMTKYLDFIHAIYCTSAIVFWLCVSGRISDCVMSYSVMKKIDSASYYIYLIHPLFIFGINDFFAINNIVQTEYTFVLRALFTYVVSILVSVLYVEIKKKIFKLKRKNS